MTTDKSAIAAKIKALMSKSIANGATEEEAMSAMSMALKLMDKYQIDMTEHEVKAEGIKTASTIVGEFFRIIVAKRLAHYIGLVSNTKPLLRSGAVFNQTKLEFFGFSGDVEFANWLYNHLQDYCLNASKAFAKQEFQKGTNVKTHHNRRAFLFGATGRIAQRIEKEIADRAQVHAQASVSRSLVIVDRKALVNAEFAKLNLRIKQGRQNRNNVAGMTRDAYAAGQAAGDKARWDRPLAGNNTEMIK